MAELVDDDSFRSLEGKSKHQLWLELCDIITKHPKEVSGLKVDAILRSGIRKFTDEVLYSALHVPSTDTFLVYLHARDTPASQMQESKVCFSHVGWTAVDFFGRLLH